MAFTGVFLPIPWAAGEHTSPPLTLPARPGNPYRLAARLNMALADLQDPTATIAIDLLGTFDGGATFVPLVGGTWQGGNPDRHGDFVGPTLSWSTSGPQPSALKLRVNLSRSMVLGADWEQG